MVMGDTLESLRGELADLKRRYLAGLSSERRDNLFLSEEIAIAYRFKAIGHPPSYPSDFLESLRAEGSDPDDLIPF